MVKLSLLGAFRKRGVLPLVVFVASMLAGCAGLLGGSGKREFLEPWLEISGAQLSKSSGEVGSDYLLLQRPGAISVRGNSLYLVDAGQRRIYRYDRLQQTLLPFAKSLPTEAGMSIYVGEDQSVYFSSPSSAKIRHFTWDGFPLPSLDPAGIVARPLSIAVDERSGNVWVVDGLYNQITVLGSSGGLIFTIRLPQMQSLSAIATGPDGIYAIDRLAKKVFVLGKDGTYRYSFDVGNSSVPSTIAVSDDNLVFVGDDFDKLILVFSPRGSYESRQVAQIRGAGPANDFGSIDGLAVEDDVLYVSDSLNSRIQAFLINSGAIE